MLFVFRNESILDMFVICIAVAVLPFHLQKCPNTNRKLHPDLDIECDFAYDYMKI